jgi:hypothetical protein
MRCCDGIDGAYNRSSTEVAIVHSKRKLKYNDKLMSKISIFLSKIYEKQKQTWYGNLEISDTVPPTILWSV